MVKFYEANVHFYDSLASLTNALMDYLMDANGWNVHVWFPGITEITKSRLKNLLESELREIVMNVSHVGWSLHPLLYKDCHTTTVNLAHSFLSLDFQFSSSTSNTGAPLWTPVGAVLSSSHRHRAQLPANTIIPRYVGHSEKEHFLRKKLQKAVVWNTAMPKKYHCRP